MAVLAVVATALLTSAGPADATPLNTQHRVLYNAWTEQCLIESINSPNSVLLSPDHTCGDYYEWKGNGDYTIRNVLTGYCLTTTAASGTSRPVTASLCGTSAYQKWSESQFTGKPSGEMRFHNLGNDWYLDVAGTSVITAPSNTSDDGQGWWDCIDGTSC
jgi:hypothetical protein